MFFPATAALVRVEGSSAASNEAIKLFVAVVRAVGTGDDGLDLDSSGDEAIIDIGAQAYLEHWYERFGFRRSGPDYLEDGIPHLPMRLAGSVPGQ